ncbi:uncharacterized protein LOC111865868 isoform X1 [Cryptotermes secundus]|uniref:uncharacterized protein LOC111865868 isoform X1 n=1 Tax=Cryptotermes secundus TaxID=105785 RepID=UPI001454C077|nr:uncharacterized protein LOC111865868 isoform X1 [Cryptotermes secundus]
MKALFYCLQILAMEDVHTSPCPQFMNDVSTQENCDCDLDGWPAIDICAGRMTLKRKGEEEGYSAAKRARLIDLEDTEETFGSLGNSTSSVHSNLLLNEKGDDNDDVVLVLDTDTHLLWEVAELLNDLKL